MISLFPSRAKHCCFIQTLRELTRSLNPKNRLLNHILDIASFLAFSRRSEHQNLCVFRSRDSALHPHSHLASTESRAVAYRPSASPKSLEALTAAGPKVRHQITPEPMRHLIGAVLPKRTLEPRGSGGCPRVDRCCAATWAEGVEVLSVRPRAPELARDNAEPVALTGRRLTDVAEQGLLRSADLKRIQIAGRALVYGFARMNLDGHLPRWRVEENEIERVAEGVLDLFIAGVAKP